MQKFRVWWNSFKTVALLISFTLNMLFLILLLLLLMQVFQIKNGLVEPLVDDLRDSVADIDEASINTTVHVDDTVPMDLNLPINQTIDVELMEDVPVAANATFTLPGGGGVINGRVDIVLPRGSVLPLNMDTTVPFTTDVPINLDVPVSFPLSETELHAPLQNLRTLLQNYANQLDDLPDSWGEVPDYVLDSDNP